LLYVAPVSGGVTVIDLSDPAAPKIAGRFATGRPISRILVSGDSLVLLESHEEATVWSLADPRAPSPSAAAPAPAESARTAVPPPRPSAPAKVLEVRGGRVILDAGAANGFAVGRRVRIAAQRLERKPDLATGGMDRFVFGVGRAELNVPLTRQLGLFGAGGAGENGWAFGELGVRTYVGGLGARGTVILSASIGYASIFDGPSNEAVGGPSVAFGCEWRL
ncbi:MAG TPA: hypothetical protein VFA20_18640, partial [Myxococcaceae bacterium]|nr:hypothetical protein [Myxococcaceae bacterium]